MPIDTFSVLISPTYRCNADCEYCYQHKTSDLMELEHFERMLRKMAAYFRDLDVAELKLYWQGGEIFTMDPEWFLRGHDICRKIAHETGIDIGNSLQSNLMGYVPQWRRVVSEMFNDNIGSSLDFPNLYRKTAGGSPDTYNETWFGRYREAREAGIQVGVIAVLNEASLSIGAHEFYAYYVEKVGINCFQINTPYPAGPPTPAKGNFPLDNDLLSAFYSDLFDIWMQKGRLEGVSISPFDQLTDYFRTGENCLNCSWAKNCANIFLGVGPKGKVGQCECWVASYPDFVFGNLLKGDMADIMNSPVRKQFLERPLRLMETEDCSECEFLAVCHGGCPVRAYSSTGNLFTKDEYCEANKTLFRLARNGATELDRLESTGREGM